MTRGTRVGTTIVGFLLVFGPLSFAISPAIFVVAVSTTLAVGAVMLLAGHMHDLRHPQRVEPAERGAEVISLDAVRAALAEPPAAGRMAIVTELTAFRADRPPLRIAR